MTLLRISALMFGLLLTGQPKAMPGFGDLPLTFEANRGQAPAGVRYVHRGMGATVSLTDRGAIIATGGAQVRVEFAKASRAARVRGDGQRDGKVNDFRGNDPTQWRSDIPTYAAARYASLYPGIDLVFHGRDRQLEFDFEVAPHADPSRIRLKVPGSDIRIDESGDAILGTIRLRKPALYQTVGGARRNVAGGFVLRGKELAFEIAEYDRDQTLVIDPVISYGVVIGRSGVGGGRGVAVDAQGNAYIIGYTSATNVQTVAPVQSANAGGFDIVVAKVNPAGTALLYATYLGGSSSDVASGIAIDSQGAAYVTGITLSTNFPIKGAFQGTAGGSFDVFVAKLSTSGSLVYSSYLGGSGAEDAGGIAVDAQGSAYLTGSTQSTNFPTPNGYQRTLGGSAGTANVYVTKVSADGSSLVYGTYLGGSSGAKGNAIALDAAGNASVCGSAGRNFPLQAAVQATFGGSSREVRAYRIVAGVFHFLRRRQQRFLHRNQTRCGGQHFHGRTNWLV